MHVTDAIWELVIKGPAAVVLLFTLAWAAFRYVPRILGWPQNGAAVVVITAVYTGIVLLEAEALRYATVAPRLVADAYTGAKYALYFSVLALSAAALLTGLGYFLWRLSPPLGRGGVVGAVQSDDRNAVLVFAAGLILATYVLLPSFAKLLESLLPYPPIPGIH